MTLRSLAISFAVVLCLAGRPSASASIVWTYDFPGTPGSGLASAQTNGQPTVATFGNFTRVNLTAGSSANVFDSTFWNNGSTINTTQYESFTLTAASGYHLNLSQLAFDETAGPGGPTKGRVQLFLNGSTTAYASFDYNPDASFTHRTFDFTDTTDADNITAAEFRFYGWNGGTPSASLLLDNVALTVNVIPEPGNFLWALLPIGLSVCRVIKSRGRKWRAGDQSDK